MHHIYLQWNNLWPFFQCTLGLARNLKDRKGRIDRLGLILLSNGDSLGGEAQTQSSPEL